LGRYEDGLQALGRFIEPYVPYGLQVVEAGDRIQFFWRSQATGERHFESTSLEALRAFGRSLRTEEERAPRAGSSELLRAIGRQLDELGADGLDLSQTEDGFWVSAQVGEELRWFTSQRTDLAELADELQRRRRELAKVA